MTGIAHDGSPFNPSDHSYSKKQSSEGQEISDAVESLTSQYNIDHLDISEVNRALVRSAHALSVATTHLRRELTCLSEAESRAKHEFNVAMLQVSGGTEKSRVAAAELVSEEYWNELRLQQAKVQTLKNDCFTIRAALDAYQAVSNNLRAEIRVQ